MLKKSFSYILILKQSKNTAITFGIKLALSLYTFLGYAQQDSQYTQYMYNTFSFNPAYAGSRGVLNVTGLYRSQWVGLEGAPRTQTLAIHSPLNEKSNLGVGISAINDQAGPLNETNMAASVSYTIPIGRFDKISFGLSAGGTLLNADILTLQKQNPEDPFLQSNIDNRFSPSIGVGAYYRTDQFYIGLSVPNLLETRYYDDEALTAGNAREIIAKERMNYYLISGYIFQIAPLLKFKPAVLTKYASNTPLQVDLSTSFLYNDKITFGLAYRWSKALSGLVGFQITERILIGFAYDQEISELGRSQVSNGSYEALLRFELKTTYKRYLTPRFF